MKEEWSERYSLHAAIYDDIAQGWVWIRDLNHESTLRARRRVVRLQHTHQGATRTIYCEALFADNWDLKRFKDEPGPAHEFAEDRLAFINSWYRTRLGIKSSFGTEIDLKVELGGWRAAFLWPAYACLEHPQVVVRLATWLGLIAFGLGWIGLGLGLLALDPAQQSNPFIRYPALAMMAFGVALFVLSNAWFRRGSP